MKVVIFSEWKALKSSKVLYCPAIKTLPLKKKFPQKTYDYLLLTSKNSIRYSKDLPKAKRVVIIGQETARGYKFRKDEKVIILKKSNQDGIFKFFKKKGRPGESVFFPRSQVADSSLVKRLRDLKFKVCVRSPYTTKSVPIRKPLLSLLAREKSLSFIVSSGTIIKSLRASFKVRELRNFPVYWIAIGPVTQRALFWLKRRVQIPINPNLESAVKLALQRPSSKLKPAHVGKT